MVRGVSYEKTYIRFLLIVLLVSLLVITGCSQEGIRTEAKKTTQQTSDETIKVVKQPIPGVTKFKAPKDTTLGVPENKNLVLVLGNDGTAPSTIFKVEVLEETDTGKIDAQLPGGEFYTIQRGDEEKIGIGIRTEVGTEKGSNVKFVIKVTSDNEDYASGSFVVSL